MMASVKNITKGRVLIVHIDQKQLICKTGHRPSSSLRGAHSSLPKVYADQENHLSDSRCGLAGVESGREKRDVRVEAGVEVHGDMNYEDHAEDGPFLLEGEAIAKLFPAV